MHEKLIQIVDYISRFYVDIFGIHPDFETYSIVMNLLNGSTQPLASESGVTISAVSNNTVSSQTYNNITLTYSQSTTPNYTSDFYLYTNDVTQVFIEDYSNVLSLELTCSKAGSTTIIYSIANYGSSTAPAWAIIDSSSGQLSFSTPNVTADTVFPFYVNSVISGAANPIQKLVKITVLNWAAANWLKWLGQNNTTWQTWSSGYILASGTWIIQTSNSSSTTSSTSNSTEPSTTSKSVGTAIQTMNGATAGVVVVSSILNTSSLSSLWWVFNQMQIFLLLVLSGVYLPIDVENILTGLKFALSPLDYVPLSRIQFYSIAFSVFNFTLNNITLNSIGIQSESSIFNNFSILLAILHVIPIHLFIIWLRGVTKKFNPTKKCTFSFLLKWLIEKWFVIMTFGYYIRLFMEMNQLMLISSIYEINRFDTTNMLRIVSLAVAFIVLLICISIVLSAIYLALSLSPNEESKHSKFEEFFSGIKERRSSRLYIIVLLFRRIIFVSVLICLISMTTIQIVIASLSIVQLVYVSYLIILRPYDSVKTNLIDIINELFFTWCIWWLVYFDSKSKWNSVWISVFIWIVSSNSLITFAVVIGKVWA